MGRYTQRQAIEATRRSYKATYIRVAEYVGFVTDDRDKAKKYLEEFAEKEGVTVYEIFNSYNEALEYSIQEDLLNGYFDF